jgi:nitroreductase
VDIDNLKDLLWNSQRCQRNWDLSKSIPSDDIDTMLHAIRSAPSKQNEVHFKVFVVNDYYQRKKIYDGSLNFAHNADGEIDFNSDGTINYKKQSQLMANTLFVFCTDKDFTFRTSESWAAKDITSAGKLDFSTDSSRNDAIQKHIRYGLHSIGIAVGYLLLTAHMLGYKTGVSGGFNPEPVIQVVNDKNPQLIVGVGYEDKFRDRREEHFEIGRLFPTWNKDIEIKWI